MLKKSTSKNLLKSKAPKVSYQKYSQVFPLWQEAPGLASTFIQRRKKHEKHIAHSFFVSGVPREPGSENLWHMNGQKIFQDPVFMFLTGINQPGLVLGFKKTSGWVLFIPPKNPDREFWDGFRFGYLENPPSQKQPDFTLLKQLTGLTQFQPLSELESFFKSCVGPTIHLFYHSYAPLINQPQPSSSHPPQSSSLNTSYITQPEDPTSLQNKAPPPSAASQEIKTDHHYAFYTQCARWKSEQPQLAHTHLESFALQHYKLQLPLGKREVNQVLQANKWTAQAFLQTLKHWKSFHTEAQIQHYLEFELNSRSSTGLSFPSIVASGANAATLHYLKNDEALPRQGLVLIDFGVRCKTMHADISRTLPVRGTFNPLQSLLYQIILDAQILNEQHALAGSTLRTLNQRVWDFIEEQIHKKIISPGGTVQRAYTNKPHGVSHLMGEAEHDGDPFRIYQDEPLQAGWQISNEPGLYGTFTLQVGKKIYSETLGIRIEDNLIIQKKGPPLNASASLPKTISELEKIMKINLKRS